MTKITIDLESLDELVAAACTRLDRDTSFTPNEILAKAAVGEMRMMGLTELSRLRNTLAAQLKRPDQSPCMIVDRKSDMDTGDSYMRLTVEEDGDVIVTVYERARNGDEAVRNRMVLPNSVQFCTLRGGGKSPRTRFALTRLFRAMSEDNADSSTARGLHEFAGDIDAFK